MAVTRIPLPDWAKEENIDDRLDMPLAETGLTVRTVNCLEEEGILLVRDVLNCTPARLLEIPNFGQKTLEEVFRALKKVGFSKEPRSEKPERGGFALLGGGE